MSTGFRTRSLIIGFALAIVAGALPASAAQASLVAPRSACSEQANENAREGAQEDAMRCLINYARDHAGVGGLNPHSKLEKAAGRKQRDVVDCGFSHTACGVQADLYPHKFGYTQGTNGWALGENLAWGRGDEGSARKVLKAWLASRASRNHASRCVRPPRARALSRLVRRQSRSLGLGTRGRLPGLLSAGHRRPVRVGRWATAPSPTCGRCSSTAR